MTNPSVNQTAIITERRWNPQRTTYDYTARAISAYSATAVSKRGEAPDVTPTDKQVATDIATVGLFGEDTVIGSQQSYLSGSNNRAARVYLGWMSGDNGRGLYFKEYNGVNWEVRGYMRLRDPSTWLVVSDLGFGMSADNVGLS